MKNNLNDEIVEGILSMSLQVKTNKGDRIIDIINVKNEKGSTIAFNSDDMKQPRDQIIITLNCDGYSLIVE